jgi:hypothetical protein
MFRVEREGPDRLHVEFSGRIDAEGMDRALNALLEAGEGMEQGRLRMTIPDYEFPSLGAIGVELRRLPSLLRFLRRFDRIAVLSPERWLRKAGEFEGRLFPGLEIRAFSPAEGAEAEAWLAQRSDS